jgi:hypothetical protein
MTTYPNTTGGGGTPGGGTGSSTQTRLSFAQAVLQGLGLSPDHNRLVALLAWMAGENTTAAFNPFATTHQMPGSSSFNSVGVQNFTDFAQGVQATIETIRNGNYAAVIKALESPTSTPEQIASAVIASPWGTTNIPTQNVAANYQQYAGIQLGTQGSAAGGGAGTTGAPGSNTPQIGTGANFKSVNTLPGVEGKDYHFVTNGGRTYVVYSLNLGTVGKQISMAWRVTKDEEAALGVSNAVAVSNEQFKNLQVFGDASLITANNANVHPWQTYIQQLQQIYGHVSWLNDAGYMKTMMLGWFEGWDSATLAQALTTTKWYQSQSDWARQWTTKSATERKAETKGMVTQMTQAMEQLYGDQNPWTTTSGADAAKIQQWANNVMGGKFGDPQTGFQVWLNDRRNEAKGISGTTAWTDAQQAIQSQNAFINGPEQLFGQLRDQASAWLGYSGKNAPNIPTDTLKKWANDVWIGTKSQTDFDAFLQNQAHAMYPYLPTGSSWQDFAGAYKARAENLLGTPIDWSNTILQNLGGRDSSGQATGQPMSFDQFEQNLRHTDAFWNSNTAKTEGFSLLANLDSMMNGTTY